MKSSWLAGFVFACTLAGQSNPGASIEGHVNALTGAPVRKARVNLKTLQVRLAAETDAEGGFQFTALPPWTYRLSASHPGFLDRSSRGPVPLGPNDQVTDAEVRLPPQGVIAGEILDLEGDPVGGAQVMIVKQVYRASRTWDRLSGTPTTGDIGGYRYPNLSPGRYLVEAYDPRPPIDNRQSDTPITDYVRTY